MLNQDSIVGRVNSYDAHNFDHVKQVLKYAAMLPDDVVELYTMHREAISPHLTTSPARSAGALFALSQKHLVLGTIALFRLYSAQMYRETRAAVEAAGIAHAIQTDTKSFKVLTEDDGSETARKLARKTFAPGILFPKTMTELALLGNFYDTASRLSHTSGLTFVRHLSEGPTEGQVKFSYQDIQMQNIEWELPKSMFWLCMTHLAILAAADVVFSSTTGADMSKFAKERRDVLERLNRFNANHDNKLSSLT